MVETIKTEVKETVKCFHCGAPCLDRISHDDKAFCCIGCRTVYDILNEHGLDDYYDYERNPGLNMRERDSGKYLFLNNVEIADSLLDFNENELARINLYIPSIHCSSCIWLLENLHVLNKGVSDSRVNFMRREASITFNKNELSLRQLADLLDKLGYGPLINWDSKSRKKGRRSFGSLQIKLGVSGFCFGNIMLLSFPEYFGFDLTDNTFQTFFSYLNLILAIPVVLYSGSGYLTSAVKGLRSRQINIDVPIALGILALFLRSSYEVITEVGPGYFDSLSGLVFFLLTGKWFQDKTYENLSFERDYKSYFPLAISRQEGDGSEIVPIQDLKNGDIVKVRNNEIIPADCTLISAETQIDYSFVTGEETPIRKMKGETIYAGGRQKGVDIQLEVRKPVDQSYLTSLWDSGGEDKLPSQKIIDQIARYFTIIVLGIALTSGVVWSFNDSGRMWEIVTAILIVACPCALALSVPFTYGNVIRRTGRSGFYLKSSSVVEKFHKADTFIFDKTGTLTWPARSELTYVGEELSRDELLAIKALASSSFHPLSAKLSDSIEVPGKLPEAQAFKEMVGKGITANVNSRRYRLGNLEFTNYQGEAPANRSVVGIEIDGLYRGRFEVSTVYRQGFKEVLRSLSKDFKLGMLSGDRPFDRQFLEQVFPPGSDILFELTPDEKRDYIVQLGMSGRKTVMIGDGLNDAAALSSSDVGIAVTDNISSFSPACDVIFNGDNFHLFNRLIAFLRSSRKVVIASFVISFLYNIIGLAFAVTGNLTPIFAAILMPLSSLSILAFTTIAVNLSARNHSIG